MSKTGKAKVKKAVNKLTEVVTEGTKKLIEDVVDDVSSARTEIEEHLEQYRDFFGYVVLAMKILCVLHVLFYIVVISLIGFDSLLVGYGAQFWGMPSLVIPLVILYFNYNLNHLVPTKPNVLKNIWLILQIILMIGVFTCSGLFIIKYSMDANHCASVQGGTFNFGTFGNNVTLPGIGLAAVSPIVCTTAGGLYGKWVTIDIFMTLSAFGNLALIMCLFVVMWWTKPWNLLTAFWYVAYAGFDYTNGDLEEFAGAGVDVEQVVGSDAGFLDHFNTVSGHAKKRSRFL